MTNPTTGSDKADSAGRFKQIYMAAGSLVDVITKDAVGVTLTTELSVSPLGTSSAAQSYDFTNSRLAERGSGGTVYIEAGDATGDDIGGTMSIGGWNGTQADLISINAVLVNILGRLKEGGYKLPGVVRQEAVTFATVASVAIPLTNEPTGVRQFDIDIIDLVMSVAGVSPVNLIATFSYDGGSTYTAAAYGWAINAAYLTTNAPTGSTSDTSGRIAQAVDSAGSVASTIRMSVTTPNSVVVGSITVANGTFQGTSHSNGPQSSTFALTCPTTGRATHMKLATSSGTFTGAYRVIPQRGLGEV